MEFHIGDLLEYSPKLATNTKNKLNRRFPEFARCHHNVCCIYVRMVDKEQCEVIPCTIKVKSDVAQCFDTELLGQRHNILACSKRMYTVKVKYFTLSPIYPLVDPENAVNSVLQKRKAEKIQRRFEKKMNEDRTSDLHRQYRNAVMSNDRKEMARLVTILGYEPTETGFSSSSKKTQYRVSNPKPYQGGRFTPK